MSSTLRFVYFGLPLGALILRKAGFFPRVIGIGHPDAPGRRRLWRGTEGPAPLILGRPDLTQTQIVRAIESAEPDALLSWFWPRKLPPNVLALPRLGAFGVHPSLLPRWRGPDPCFWAIHAGDRITGVTLHRLDQEYDTGHIVAQQRVAIDPKDTSFSLARRLDRPSLALLVDCARRLSAGEPLTGTPQPTRGVTCANAPDDETLRIVWERSVDEILRLIRAAAPYPGASCMLDSEIVEVVEAEAFPRPLPQALVAGEAIQAREGVIVCAENGGILLGRVRRDDGSLLSGVAITTLFRAGLAWLPEAL